MAKKIEVVEQDNEVIYTEEIANEMLEYQTEIWEKYQESIRKCDLVRCQYYLYKLIQNQTVFECNVSIVKMEEEA